MTRAGNRRCHDEIGRVPLRSLAKSPPLPVKTCMRGRVPPRRRETAVIAQGASSRHNNFLGKQGEGCAASASHESRRPRSVVRARPYRFPTPLDRTPPNHVTQRRRTRVLEQHQHAGRTQYNARYKKSCQLKLYCRQQQTPPIAASTKKRMLLSSGLSEARTTPRGVGAGRDGFPAPLLHNRRRENTHTHTGSAAARRAAPPRAKAADGALQQNEVSKAHRMRNSGA